MKGQFLRRHTLRHDRMQLQVLEEAFSRVSGGSEDILATQVGTSGHAVSSDLCDCP